jgi:hypothetical protein
MTASMAVLGEVASAQTLNPTTAEFVASASCTKQELRRSDLGHEPEHSFKYVLLHFTVFTYVLLHFTV